MSTSKYFFVLHEGSLLTFVWYVLLGRRPAVIEIRPFVSAGGTFITKIVKKLRSRGWATYVPEDDPDLIPQFGLSGRIDLCRRNNLFMRRENEIATYYEFDKLAPRYRNYIMSYQHISSMAALRNYELMYAISNVLEKYNPTVVGLHSEFQALYAAIFETAPQNFAKSTKSFFWNGLFVLAAASLTLLAILKSATIYKITPKKFFLFSDYAGDPRNSILWNELKDGGEIFALFRTSGLEKDFKSNFPNMKYCSLDDGQMSVYVGMKTLIEVGLDFIRILFASSHLSPESFRELVKLPYARAKFRALFHLYRPKFFWARDDYNPEHIVRSQELRRLGIRSISAMHGIPTMHPVVEQLRYMDFDLYYIFGRDLYTRFYKKKWPSYMKVKDVGSFGLTREQLLSLPQNGKRNIAIFLEPSFFSDKAICAVHFLAKSFPDRDVFVNVKHNRKTGAFGQKLDRLIESGPDNLKIHNGAAYELFFHCAFCVGDGTTLTMEAIQFGLPSYHMDFDERWIGLYYRDAPEICVSSKEELVKKIKQYEIDHEFPWNQLGEFIDLSGRIVWDVVRKDLCLPAKGDQFFPHPMRT